MATGEGFFSTLFLVKVPEAQLHSAALTGVLALAAGLVVIGFTMLTRVGAWRPWVFFLIAVAATGAPWALSGRVMSGATMGRDPVYQMGPASLFLFALAVAIGAPRREGSERFAVR